MHRVRSNSNMANASTSTSSSVADRDWNDVMRYAEQLLHERVRREIAKVSDDPDAIKEFVETKGVYVVGSTVAWAMAKAKGYAGDELPADLNIYAKNPLLVARTDIGVRHLGTLKKHSCVAQRCYAGEGPNNNGRCTDNTKPYDDSARRILDISGKVFADIEAAVRGFDSDIYHAAYDVAANRLVPCSERWTRLMKMDAGAVFTYYMDYDTQGSTECENHDSYSDIRVNKTLMRARNWFRGSCKIVGSTDKYGPKPPKNIFLHGKEANLDQEMKNMIARGGSIPWENTYPDRFSGPYRPAPWKCVVGADEFTLLQYKCKNKACRKTATMDKSFCSLIGLCTSCYVYIETVLVRTLTGRTRDYNYFHVTRRGDVIKSSSWTLAKATYDRVFRMERNEHEDGIVIVERDCGTQLLDVKYILNQILSTYQYRDNAFYTKYSVTRMIFMGFYPKENADLKNMVSELAVSGIQVFFYEDRRPIATVEWGAIFDQLSGVYDTDEFLNIQPNFTNSSGKVVTANEPVFPNLSRAIKFKHSVKRIFKRKALMVAVRNLFTTDHDDELRLKKPLKPVKPVIPAATVPQQKRKRRNSEPSVEFQHEKRVKLNFPATPIRKPIKSAPLRMPENWSLTVCPRTISLPVVKVEKKKKTYDSDESYDSDDLGTEISYGNNESYDSDVSYDSDDLGTEISYGNYEYESSSVSETTYIESSNDSDDETDQENVESNSDSESDINIRLRSEPLPRRDQTKSSDSENRCEHCDVIPQLSQLYADMTKHYDNLNKIWQRK